MCTACFAFVFRFCYCTNEFNLRTTAGAVGQSFRLKLKFRIILLLANRKESKVMKANGKNGEFIEWKRLEFSRIQEQ